MRLTGLRQQRLAGERGQVCDVCNSMVVIGARLNDAARIARDEYLRDAQ
jgi:hypothetical protein